MLGFKPDTVDHGGSQLNLFQKWLRQYFLVTLKLIKTYCNCLMTLATRRGRLRYTTNASSPQTSPSPSS